MPGTPRIRRRAATTRPLLAFAALGVLFLSPSVRPARAVGSAGSRAAAFLRIPVGPRLMASPAALAGRDVFAPLANPAFATRLPRARIGLTTTEWFDGSRLSALAFATPLGPRGLHAWGGLRLLGSPSLAGFDAALNAVTRASAWDGAISAGLALRRGGLSVGAGVSALRQHLLSADGDGVAVDVGVAWRRGATGVHAAWRDLGGRVAWPDRTVDVDATFVVGVTRRVGLVPGALHTGVELVHDASTGSRLSAGLAWAPARGLRMALSVPDAAGSIDDVGGLSGGLGVSRGAWSLDYAWTPHAVLGTRHTFALTVIPGRWGHPVQGPEATTDLAPSRFASQPVPASAWLVVAGEFGDRPSARAERMRLERAGIPCEIVASGARWRVVVGRFATADEARRLARRCAAFGSFRVVAE